MKKNYIYMAAPLVALAIFTGIYFKYSSSYDDRMAEMHRKELETAQAKLNEDAKELVEAKSRDDFNIIVEFYDKALKETLDLN